MADSQTSLWPFVPKLALRLLRDSPAVPQETRKEDLQIGVLLADVSGFTRLVDMLAGELGPRGAERLQEVLNTCFAPLTEMVDAAGGEVLGFPGDGALAVWIAEGSGPDALCDAVRHCAACALDLQARLDGRLLEDGIELRLRVAIGAGPAWAALVGGMDGRWETVLVGDALQQLGDTLDSAQAGEVVMSPTALAVSGSSIGGHQRGPYRIVTDVDPPVLPLRREPARSELPVSLVRAFVSPAVVDLIGAGHERWLAEFRLATVVFVHVRDGSANEHLLLHRGIHAIQSIVAALDGAVNHVLADEKGLTVVVAFGVVQRAHEDDPVRAVRAALEATHELRRIGIHARAGVATGRLFAGGCGGGPRLEFTLLGPSMVLAARLAGLAEDVLCDAATRAASRKAVRFEAHSPVTVKGKSTRVEVWRPRSLKTVDDGTTALIGRVAEAAMLRQRLTALEREGKGGVIILRGEPGIGKTSLVNDFLRRAQTHGVRAVTGAANSIEHAAYLPWRRVLGSIFGLDVTADAALLHRITEMLGPGHAHLLPLLNSILPGMPSENEHTSEMDAESRARTTRGLIVQLLEAAAAAVPLVVVLEDVHWMDSASAQLAEQAVAGVPRLLLLMTARTSIGGIDPVERLRAREDATVVHLAGLSDVEIGELICRRLDADSVPDDAVAMIHRRAEGHPFFAEELSLALRSRGVLVVNDGTCELNSVGAIDYTLPDTVYGIVSTRIDQLTPQCQLTLKVASVLGREFHLAELVELHPVVDARQVEQEVAALLSIGLLRRSPDVARPFEFSHAIVQEVTYGLLSFNQRRELHRRTAELLERTTSGSPDESASVLAHHWERADAPAKAMHHLEKAGDNALRNSSNREAADFFTRLTRLAQTTDAWATSAEASLPTGRTLTERSITQARWERLLAQALVRDGRNAEAIHHLQRSLTLLGDTVPEDSIRCRLELAGGMAARLLFRSLNRRRRKSSGNARLALLEIARAYELLSRQMYLGHAPGSTLVQGGLMVLRSVSAAEFAGPSVELSKAYSTLASLVGMVGVPRGAGYYAEQGRRIALEVGDAHALFSALTAGKLPAFVQGDWQDVAAALEEALVIGARLRLGHDCHLTEVLLGYVYFNQGRLDDVVASMTKTAGAAKEEHIVPHLWASVLLAETKYRQGRLAEAVDIADDALAYAAKVKSTDQNSRFQAHGLLASAWLRLEGAERARPHLDQAVDAARTVARMSYTPQFGFIGIAEVLFAMAAGADDGRAEATRRLRHWLRTLKAATRGRPILRPWSLYFRGRWHAEHGRRALAMRRFRQAVQSADRLTLQYESAVARTDLARMMRVDDPDRIRMLEQALRTFGSLGAALALRDAQRLTRG